MSTARALREFLAAQPAAALVEVAEAKGSTPREQGAWMLVAPDVIFGTIGGGQLEFLAIAEARKVLSEVADLSVASASAPSTTLRVVPLPRKRGRISGAAPAPPLQSGGGGPHEVRWRGPLGRADAPPQDPTLLDIPLGPEIGQCCGGRVKLSVTGVNDEVRSRLLALAAREDAERPHVLLFGCGHVGHALAQALSLLPLTFSIVETRAEALTGLPDGVEAKLLPLPEVAVRDAPPGSSFVILTHDHALDFLLAAEALKRGDAAYVGMIGSRTKRSTFRRWFQEEAGGTADQFGKLVCPIGGSTVHDKRPAVIAALAAAEIVAALATTRPFSHPASMS